jgi:hypothetical protein
VGRVLSTRSDSGQRQLNYSELGGLTAAISTYSYHPQSDFGNVMSACGPQMGRDAVACMIKEFWTDVRKHSNRKHDQPSDGQASNSK